MAGFVPGQEEMFYKKFPSEEHFFKAYPKARSMAKGGSLSGAPHNGQPTEKQFYNPGWMPDFPDYFYAMGGEPCFDCGGMSKYPGGGITTPPQFSNAQQFHQWNKQQGNALLPGDSMTYYNPKQFQVTPKAQGSNDYTVKALDPNVTTDALSPNRIASQYTYSFTPPTAKPIQQTPAKVTPTSNRTAVGFGTYGPGSVSYQDNVTGMVTHYDKSGQVIPVQAFGGELPEAKKGWIQKATASIKRRGTEGVCTGSKFGSSSCPPGSKRYNLAKTFRKMARNRAEGGETVDGMSEQDFLEQYHNDFMGGIRRNMWQSIADEAMQEFLGQEHEPDNDADDQRQMGGAGMNMSSSYGFDPNMNNQQMFSQRANQLQQQNQQAFQSFGAATQDLGATANPYMQWSMPKALGGMFMQTGGPNSRGFLDYFPMNHNPYMKWNVSGAHPVQAQDPEDNSGDPYRYGNYSQKDLHKLGPGEKDTPNQGLMSYLQSYEAKKRFFGPGARYVKMTFRTPYDNQGLPGKNQGQDKQQASALSGFPLGYPTGAHAFDVQDNPNKGVDQYNSLPRRMGIENMLPSNLYRQQAWHDMGPENAPYEEQFPGNKQQVGPVEKMYGGIHRFLPKNQMGGMDQLQQLNQVDNQGTPAYFDTTLEGRYRMGLNPEAGANWLMAGTEGITSIFNQQNTRNAKARMKSLQGADANFAAMPAGNRGTYGQTGAYNGVFNPFNMTPVQQPGMNFGQVGSPIVFAYGGGYNFGGNMNYHQQSSLREGGEYDLDDDVINEILAAGGTVEYI